MVKFGSTIPKFLYSHSTVKKLLVFMSIVDADALVWDDPFYPFLVYGIGAAVCEIFLVPLKLFLVKRCKKLSTAAWLFFLIVVAVTACVVKFSAPV